MSLLGGASAVLAFLLQTQQPVQPADAPGTVVVTGERLTPDEARRRADAFVRAIGAVSSLRPAARWEEPVCPRVLGLSERQTSQVEDRVRAVARAVGVPLAAAPCRGNIVVTFTDDAAGVVRDVAKRSASALAQTTRPERDALLAGTDPVRWWYKWGKRGRYGLSLAGSAPPITTSDPGATVPIVIPVGEDDGGANMQYSSSMISTQAQRVLRSATVVIDVTAVKGVPLDAIASYAALVSLAEIKVREPLPNGSILSLFTSGRGLIEPTQNDLAFLSSLYRLPLDRDGKAHRGMLVRDIAASQLGER